jgi:hypothetical protein
MDTNFVTELRNRLPEDYCGSAIWHVSQRYGLEMILHDDFLDRCEQAIAEHILMLAFYDQDQARLLMGAVGDGLPMLVVVCAEAFVGNLATRGAEMVVYGEWVSAAA